MTINKGKGQEVSYASDFVQNQTTTGQGLTTLTLKDSSAFRGGNLMLTATATVNGKTLKGQTPLDLRIDGTNPQRADIQSSVDAQVPATGFSGLQAPDISDSLKRIACQESNQTQFRASADGGIGPALISFDNGVGIFQITKTNQCPDPFTKCPNTLFGWPDNVTQGVASFQEKVQVAKRYPAEVRSSSLYHTFITMTVNVARANAGKKPISGFPAPPYTTAGSLDATNPPNQLLRDAVRGYNGYAPYPTGSQTLPIPFFTRNPLLREFVINQGFL